MGELILVLGMHRSGTSAVARGLQVLGADLGTNLMPPSSSENPTGYWEDWDIYELDREMLGALGSDWHRLVSIGSNDCETLRRSGFDRRAAALLRERTAAGQLFAFKDPRLARLLPFWKQVLREEGCSARYVVVVRNPRSVARSLHERNGFDERMGYLLWLDTMVAAIDGVLGERFVVIDYDRLMADAAGELGRLAQALDLALDAQRLAQFEREFLDPALRHHMHASAELEADPACPPLVRAIWPALQQAASVPSSQSPASTLERLLPGWVAELQQEQLVRTLLDRVYAELEQQREAGAGLAIELQEQKQATERETAVRTRVEQDLGELQQAQAELQQAHTELQHAHGALQQANAELQHARAETQRANSLLQQQLLAAEASLREQGARMAGLHAEIMQREAELRDERHTVQQIHASTSWRITRPLRGGMLLARALARRLRAVWVDPWQPVRRGWHAIPLRHEHRDRLKSALYRLAPGLFSSLPSYRLWNSQQQLLARLAGMPPEHARGDNRPPPERVSLPECDAPTVSVVIPVHGAIEYTMRCLASIERHRPRLDFEVIVVDDASPDDTVQRLGACTGLTVVRNAENQGFVHSCNAGAAVARGDFLCFLNNDTEVTDGWLDELRGSFEQFPRTGIAGSKLVYPDGRLQEAGGILWNDGSAWNFGRGEDASAPAYNYARSVDYCSGASLMIRRELFQSLGGFDSAYAPAYGEDSDLALKVRALGLSVIYQPLSVVMHHEGVSSGTDAERGVKRHQVANALKLRERWRDALASRQPPGVDPDRAKDAEIAGRVLVLDHCTPTPDQDAGSVTALNLMLLLRQAGLQVTFVPEDNFLYLAHYTPLLQRAGIEVLYAPHVRSVRAHLAECGARYDLVLMFRPTVADRHLDELRRSCPRARILYHVSDLHFLRLQREAALAGTAAAGAAAEAMRLRELAHMRAVDCVIVHSMAERDLLLPLLDRVPVQVFQWAIPIRGTRSGFEQRRDIAFLGGYRHDPNVDAVRYFVSAIFPHVRAALPGVRFLAIGSNPPDSLRALAGEAVEVTGYVEDIAPLLDRVRVAVAPLRIGAGIKGKIATTLSVGLPCVASTIAVEGMGLEDGAHVLVADTPQDFAARVVELYNDPSLWARLSRSGLEFAERTYGAAEAEQTLRGILRCVGIPVPAHAFVQRLAAPTTRSESGARQPARKLQPAAVVLTAEEWHAAHSGGPLFAAMQAADAVAGDGRNERFVVDGWCIPCGRSVPFLVDMESGGRREGERWVPNWRERLECPLCRMNNRQRLVATLLAQALEGIGRHADVYLMEQVTPVYGWARRRLNGHAIVGSEFLGIEHRGGTVVRGIRHENAMALSFADASLDVVLSNDVFEHLPDPWAGLRECARVLRPGGTLLFSVPFDPGSAHSTVRARLEPDGVQHLLPPVYHGNPVSSSGSLVYTDFGWDLLQGARDAGFASVRAELYSDAQHGHLGGSQILFRACHDTAPEDAKER